MSCRFIVLLSDSYTATVKVLLPEYCTELQRCDAEEAGSFYFRPETINKRFIIHLFKNNNNEILSDSKG